MNRVFLYAMAGALLALKLWGEETVPASNRPAASPVEKARTWWAFQALAKPVPPAGFCQPIDAFIGARLAELGFLPAPLASRSVLLRRASFDLTGLPPTPDEVAAFLADDSPQAWARVIDRLLASPAYGQRWARHWLDVARYADYHDADPKARTASCEPLEAWRYRDWVVASFNRDLPFDDFVTHQIAGDLLASPSGDSFYPEGLIATGFLVNGAWDRGDADKEKMVSDMVDDQIDTVGKAFLGLTLGCARCHDHKFDPISQEDYYGLAGMFYSTHFMENLGTKGGEITLKRLPLVPRATVMQRDGMALQLEAVQAKLKVLNSLKPPVAPDHPERKRLEEERAALAAALPPPYPVTLTVQEGGMPGGLFPNIQDVPLHIRGSYTRLGATVPRRLPEYFVGSQQPALGQGQGSGRRELARWVVSPRHPLTARVLANRIWQWHFGLGLVDTPNNFGLLSQPPSHPQLLDWLAAELIEHGWSIKHLHRRILLSQAYQRSSQVPLAQWQRDPENRWLARFSRRRLEAEVIRDAVLAVSGRLDLRPDGPAVPELESERRSLYVQTARWDRSNFATLFDAANPDASTEKRTVSTVAPQALLLLNHPFILAEAERLARRLLAAPVTEDSARIDWSYRLLFGRSARPEEIAIAQSIVAPAATAAAESLDAWRDWAHVLLCSNEFVYLD